MLVSCGSAGFFLSRAFLQQFAEVDADGSGELEFQEFADWYSARDNTGSSIENLFKSLDSDGAHMCAHN